MVSTDEDALICDLAETYGILDYRALPVNVLATLCAGLRENSRIKMKLSGEKVQRIELMIAAIVDRLSYILWSKTTDGQKGVNRPASMVSILIGDQKNESNIAAFNTPEGFAAEWASITGGDDNV